MVKTLRAKKKETRVKTRKQNLQKKLQIRKAKDSKRLKAEKDITFFIGRIENEREEEIRRLAKIFFEEKLRELDYIDYYKALVSLEKEYPKEKELEWYNFNTGNDYREYNDAKKMGDAARIAIKAADDVIAEFTIVKKKGDKEVNDLESLLKTLKV